MDAGSQAGDWGSGAPQQKMGSCLRVVMAAGGRVSSLANHRSCSRDAAFSDSNAHICLILKHDMLLGVSQASIKLLDDTCVTRTWRRNSLSWFRSAASSPAAAKKSAAVCTAAARLPSLAAPAAL